jgi:small subunit ribosomal protein S3e
MFSHNISRRIETTFRAQESTKGRRIIETGLFYAELNEILTRELAADGYRRCEVRMTPSRIEIIVKASNTGVFTEQNGGAFRSFA